MISDGITAADEPVVMYVQTCGGGAHLTGWIHMAYLTRKGTEHRNRIGLLRHGSKCEAWRFTIEVGVVVNSDVLDVRRETKR